MKRRSAGALALLVTWLVACRLTSAQQYLDVVQSPLSSAAWEAEYDDALRKTLLGDADDKPYVRVIVKPAFWPEWMIEVETPASARAVVRLVEAKGHVWNGGKKPNVRAVTVRRVTIPEAPASVLRQ